MCAIVTIGGVDVAEALVSKSFTTSAQQIDAVVGFVASDSHFHLFILREHCLCTFLLDGMDRFRGPEPYDKDAFVFAKEYNNSIPKQVKVKTTQGSNATIFYIDYGNLKTVSATLPVYPPFRQQKNILWHASTSQKIQNSKRLPLNIFAKAHLSIKCCLMWNTYHPQAPPAATLLTEDVKNLISDGLLLIDSRRKRLCLQTFIFKYKLAGDTERKKYVIISEYGDINKR
ncbi:hypothetical protein ILUMI_26385 [Ignelater luminosus]|uniref:Uncharacterized protein n=1 Tax=Ignelater luminosus TaxID=2038154 RepID=A0A8K0FVY0_IGNLU|nr:hypothetical protein ILUMI_26385 [Ignelater luminosus]